MQKRPQHIALILLLFFIVISVVPMTAIGMIAYKNEESNAQTIAASEALRFSSLLLSDIDDALTPDKDAADVIKTAYQNYNIKDAQADAFNKERKYLIFTDLDGEALYTTRPAQITVNQDALRQARDGREGSIVEQGEIITYTSLGNVIAFTHEDAPTALSHVAEFKNTLISFGALVLALGILFSFLVAWSIKRKM